MSPEIAKPDSQLHNQSTYRELYAYFLSKLPEDLPLENYTDGLSCYGFARLLVEEFGGPKNARIFAVKWYEEEGNDDTSISHAYVVRLFDQPKELAYNNYLPPILTNEEVIQQGTDITEEVYGDSWSAL